MKGYGIGLDIGIASVGWAIVALDNEEKPCGIINMGTRIFDSAENLKTGASLALPRREARGARRRLRRHRHRNERIRSLIVLEGILTEQQLNVLFEGKLEDIYMLRAKALDEPVTACEFTRILIHIAQRRGFSSNRKSSAEKEDGELLSAISTNIERMKANGYRTVGEMYSKDPRYADNKRNRDGNYISTVNRNMIADEVKLIFASQRSFQKSFAREDFEQKYLNILLSQRSFDEGPGGKSPYGGQQIEKMVGICTFEEEQPRAAKASYSFEVFNLLQKINSLRIQRGGKSTPLDPDSRKRLIDLAHKTENLNFNKIRMELGIQEGETFNLVRYRSDITLEEAELKEKFCYLRAYHQIRKSLDKVCKGRIKSLSRSQLNEIGRVLTIYKTSEKIKIHLVEAGLENTDIEALDSVGGFSKFGHLSIRACDNIIPFLEQGMMYSDACAEAGYNFKAHSSNEKAFLLPALTEATESITSPVVRRAVSQGIKVVNAIVRDQAGSPKYINVELSREMSKDFKERKNIEREMLINQSANERMMERIRNEYGKQNPTGQDLVKLKLYEEQGGVCAYSLKQMSLTRLFEPDYAEIDHIVPYSVSFDDSYKNKVLVMSKENRQKRNKLPMEYLSGKDRDNFVVWVNASVRNHRKKQLLLKESITENDLQLFRERNLQDTKTMSRFLLNYITDNLRFEKFENGRKKHVTAVNGSITAYMRKRWGINKIREDGDLHHAVDAVVIACTTDAMIHQITRHSAFRECGYVQTDNDSIAVDRKTGEIMKRFPYPWNGFRKEIETRLMSKPIDVIKELRLPFYYESDRLDYVSPIFVSRMPNRRVSGIAHKDTIKSSKHFDEGITVSKKPISTLKLDGNGEIANYYMPDSDVLLYDALKKRLKEFNGDAEKAFLERFYKPKSNGSPGNPVYKVKLYEKATLGVPVHGGKAIADNDSMIRIDVFFIDNDGYYFVPLYVADTLKKELPNKACLANKPYSEWPEMQDSDFVFSLYQNDLVYVCHKNSFKLQKIRKESTLPDFYEKSSEYLYYRKASISTASICCINHDNTHIIQSLGIKTLIKLDKYQVDVLGGKSKVRREKRMPFTGKGACDVI